MNLVAPINCLLGYGHVGWNILYHSFIGGANPTFFPIGKPNITYGDRAAECLNSTHYMAKEELDPKAPTLVVWHEFGLFEKALGQSTKIGLSFFELSALDKNRLNNLNSMDINIQASEWGANVLRHNGVKSEIKVIPCGFNPEVFYPKVNQSTTYKFFNIGKMEYRKGHDVLIKAFERTFDKSDDVELHMLWENPFLNEQRKMEWVAQYKGGKLSDRVFFRQQFNSDLGLANFIRSMDCGVFPTRSEGFGLPILQSIACGKQIITTDYSAHTEYATPHNSSLLSITEFEPSIDNVFFTHSSVPQNSFWAKITDKNFEELCEYMRFNYLNRVRKDNSKTVENLTWKNVVNKIGVYNG